MIIEFSCGKITLVIEMIDFQYLDIRKKREYDRFLTREERGCEYSFVNLFAWGRQKCAILGEQMVFFSQFRQKSVYLFPVGQGDKRLSVEAVMEDARSRGIPCRFVGLTHKDREFLETNYPGKFHYHDDRDSYDYVYDISDLADLKGKKYQKKRNHLNRFRQEYPDWCTREINEENLPQVLALAEQWYDSRLAQSPHSDFFMERIALKRVLENWKALGMEGLLLYIQDVPVAMAIGSRLTEKTFDVHFEKALDPYNGAYAAINASFAGFLREKYPDLMYLNREDDMGLEGLRKAKFSYEPHHMQDKCWACLLEDGYDY